MPNKFDNRFGDNHKDEWLTPKFITDGLGPFDLDPCSPVNRPWDTAARHYTIVDNGLIQQWQGRVWLNPPYGDETPKWIEKLAHHGNGIALIFNRTETDYWENLIWKYANGILFIFGRLSFYNASGGLGPGNSGAGSALVAFGDDNVERIRISGINGALIKSSGQGIWVQQQIELFGSSMNYV